MKILNPKSEVLILVMLLISGCVASSVPLKAKPSLDRLNYGQVTIGSPINSPKYLYPSEQLIRRQDGWALVKVDINRDGNTENVVAVDCSPVLSFCSAAEKYFNEASYNPPLKDGKSIEVKGHYFIMNFSAESQGGG